jgi:hypothetical protein
MNNKFKIWIKDEHRFVKNECRIKYKDNSITGIIEYIDAPEDLEYSINEIDIIHSINLYDMNNKEIYEGDILKIDNDFIIVNWNNRSLSFCLNKTGWMYSHWFYESVNPEDCEIIDNKYENPELFNKV